MYTGRVYRAFLLAAVLVGAALAGCGDSTTPEVVDQPMAIWSSTGPAADSPETAADAALRDLLGVNPTLGPYMSGDSRSGEMEVFSPGENGPTLRSLLLLRQLGPGDTWSVLGAIAPAIRIDQPASGSVHPAGMLTVTGAARGFEGTVLVSAHRAGSPSPLIDRQITAGGALAEVEPFQVELDLSAARPGEVIAVVVRGDTGLSDDPGEFSALPIRIGDSAAG
jgi:hypothetical protein